MIFEWENDLQAKLKWNVLQLHNEFGDEEKWICLGFVGIMENDVVCGWMWCL